jgi:acetylglutamate kinase
MKTLWLIKIGGNVIDDADRLKAFLKSFQQIPDPKLLVHGGGKLASALAQQLGVPVRMVDGRRLTDAAMLEVVTMVYGGRINKTIVAGLQAVGCNAIGLTGADGNIIRANKRTGWEQDYGFVGDIERVDEKALSGLIEMGLTPVVAPLTHDRQGSLLNTNADTIAAKVAVALAGIYQISLVFCFEKPGVLENPADDESVYKALDYSSYLAQKSAGTISGGMIPKLDNAFAAMREGVQVVQICQAEGLLSLLGDHPAGTRLKL